MEVPFVKKAREGLRNMGAAGQQLLAEWGDGLGGESCLCASRETLQRENPAALAHLSGDEGNQPALIRLAAQYGTMLDLRNVAPQRARATSATPTEALMTGKDADRLDAKDFGPFS
jgi:hypothetical protein